MAVTLSLGTLELNSRIDMKKWLPNFMYLITHLKIRFASEKLTEMLW